MPWFVYPYSVEERRRIPLVLLTGRRGGGSKQPWMAGQGNVSPWILSVLTTPDDRLRGKPWIRD